MENKTKNLQLALSAYFISLFYQYLYNSLGEGLQIWVQGTAMFTIYQ